MTQKTQASLVSFFALALFHIRLIANMFTCGQIKKNLCSKFYTSIMRALKECYAIFFSQKT